MSSSRVVPAAYSARAQFFFAGLGRRLAAHLFDMTISASVFLVVDLTMRGLRAIGLWRPATKRAVEDHDLIAAWHALGAFSKLALVLGFILSMGVIYSALFESSAWQATFGKRLLDMHVTDDEGRRIGVRRALGRWFWKFFLDAGGEGTTGAEWLARSLARSRLVRYSLRLADADICRNYLAAPNMRRAGDLIPIGETSLFHSLTHSNTLKDVARQRSGLPSGEVNADAGHERLCC